MRRTVLRAGIRRDLNRHIDRRDVLTRWGHRGSGGIDTDRVAALAKCVDRLEEPRIRRVDGDAILDYGDLARRRRNGGPLVRVGGDAVFINPFEDLGRRARSSDDRGAGYQYPELGARGHRHHPGLCFLDDNNMA